MEGGQSDVARAATAALLWEAARPFPDPVRTAAASRAGVDTDLFVRAAIEQWVGPLVWHGLSLAGCTDRLGAAAAELRANAAHWGAKTHFLAGSASLALTSLTAAGLEPVVLKGAALADRYPDPSLRPMGDIDLLLPSRSHGAAIAALVRGGWSVVRPLDRLRHETTLVHPEAPTLTLELHAVLERWHDRVTGVVGDAVWARRRPAVLLGSEAFTLAPEDELLVLAAHAGKPFHCFERLMWFADLAVVIATAHGGLDWDVVRRRAAETRCSTVLAVALTHAERLGATVPDDVFGVLPRQGWRGAVLAPMLQAEWPLALPGLIIRRRSRYALCETWPRRGLLFLGESPHDPLRRQPILLGRRAWMALLGLPRLGRARRP